MNEVVLTSVNYEAERCIHCDSSQQRHHVIGCLVPHPGMIYANPSLQTLEKTLSEIKSRKVFIPAKHGTTTETKYRGNRVNLDSSAINLKEWLERHRFDISSEYPLDSTFLACTIDLTHQNIRNINIKERTVIIGEEEDTVQTIIDGDVKKWGAEYSDTHDGSESVYKWLRFLSLPLHSNVRIIVTSYHDSHMTTIQDTPFSLHSPYYELSGNSGPVSYLTCAAFRATEDFRYISIYHLQILFMIFYQVIFDKKIFHPPSWIEKRLEQTPFGLFLGTEIALDDGWQTNSSIGKYRIEGSVIEAVLDLAKSCKRDQQERWKKYSFDGEDKKTRFKIEFLQPQNEWKKYTGYETIDIENFEEREGIRQGLYGVQVSMSDGKYRGVYVPSVFKEGGDMIESLVHNKAGIPRDFKPKNIIYHLFTTIPVYWSFDTGITCGSIALDKEILLDLTCLR